MHRMLALGRGWKRLAVLAMVAALLLAALPTVAFAATGSAPEAVAASGTWYTVKSGDTLSELARDFGTSVQAIKDANGLSSTRIYVGQRLWIPGGHPAPVGCAQHYWVRSGDNLSRIARHFGVSVSALARANNLANASLIYVGQKLCIPGGGHPGGDPGGHPGGGPGGPGGCWYTVRAGDNLSRIAAAHGVSWAHLAHVNHLANPRVIIPGQKLWVCK